MWLCFFLLSLTERAQLLLQCCLYQGESCDGNGGCAHLQPALCVQRVPSTPALPCLGRFLIPLCTWQLLSWLNQVQASESASLLLISAISFSLTTQTSNGSKGEWFQTLNYLCLRNSTGFLCECHIRSRHPEHHTPSCPRCCLLLKNCKKLDHGEKKILG